jgi:hypothetical protein
MVFVSHFDLRCLEAKKVTRVLSVAALMRAAAGVSRRSRCDNVSTSTSYVRTVAISASENTTRIRTQVQKYEETTIST